MIYQLMKVFSGGETGTSGHSNTNLKRLKTRLSKMKKGWIEQIDAPKGANRIVAARGFSRDAMDAMQACGGEAVAGVKK